MLILEKIKEEVKLSSRFKLLRLIQVVLKETGNNLHEKNI